MAPRIARVTTKQRLPSRIHWQGGNNGEDDADPANRVADGGRDDRARGPVRAGCLRRCASGPERQHGAGVAHQHCAALARPATARRRRNSG